MLNGQFGASNYGLTHVPSWCRPGAGKRRSQGNRYVTLPALLDKDPTELGFPPMLPIELAMGVGSTKDICETYGIDLEAWEKLTKNIVFVQAVSEAKAMAKAEGGAFKMKAKTMAELMLNDLYNIAAGRETDAEGKPANVALRADLMKFMIRIAGLDASIEQRAQKQMAGVVATATININLG